MNLKFNIEKQPTQSLYSMFVASSETKFLTDIVIEELIRSMSTEKESIIGIYDDFYLVGYARISMAGYNYTREGRWHIGPVYISPEYRNKKVGSAFIEWSKERYDKLSATVDVNNDSSNKLFETSGFKTTEDVEWGGDTPCHEWCYPAMEHPPEEVNALLVEG